ncbi:hypothetical protein DSO57_1025077 [Entomophthora muscae]|uniref:Uncharacterized protein n=1 Tax=Entomophthora muscae TaxID=34485 RepID=A0ACC2T2W3_9FUNG|nr:hypothetical protein DSO57_1025077 [Entomophthora muscae]
MLSADQSPLSPPDPPSDKESSPSAGPNILHLFQNLSSDSEPEDSDCNESYGYGYSVLAVLETVSVPYKLCSGKTTTTTCPNLSKANVIVACPYLAQAHFPPVLVDSSEEASELEECHGLGDSQGNLWSRGRAKPGRPSR